MQPKTNLNNFEYYEVFGEIELLSFQKTPCHHQKYDVFSNDDFLLCLMDHFLFLNWNVASMKTFLVFHVLFLFPILFNLLGNWYCCAHQILLLILIFLKNCDFLFFVLVFIFTYVVIFFKCIFINILTYLICFLFSFTFDLVLVLRIFHKVGFISGLAQKFCIFDGIITTIF